MRKFLAVSLMTLGFTADVYAQNGEKPKKEMKYNLTTDGKKYVKLTFLNQTWLRWNQSNPGTMVNGDPQPSTVDIGLRRTRMQLYGRVSDHVFFYMQFGMNNFNFLSQNAGNRKLQAFFHDAVTEYIVFKDNDMLKIGGGLTIANGLSRFTQPGIGSIMTTDVPVFLQSTVDQTDEFARKLSIYARGQIGKVDYRVALSDPFPVQTNGQIPPAIGKDATFTTYGHTKQLQGMLIYNFLEKEPHTTPYMAGTYLGDKKILNLEAGAIYQRNAMWYLNGVDTAFSDMLHWSVAMFADMPIMNNKYAISAYAGYIYTDYGKDYVRNSGQMNPANGNADPLVYNGAGNSYPMFGTGSNIYAQAGFRLPNDLLGDLGTLMPYASIRWADYTKLADPVKVYDIGVNWLMDKHISKLSLNYQLRPIFQIQPGGAITHTENKSCAWLQYQISF